MKKHLQRLWHRFLAQDWLAVAAAAGLLAGGLCFIYSASWRGEETGIAGAWFGRQVQWGIVGGAVALVLALCDYRAWIRGAWWLWLAAVGGLALVLVAGVRVYGASRWLRIGPALLQPSEFAKVALVVLLARVLGGGAIGKRSFAFVAVALLLAAPVFLLILEEPDLGTAMVIPPTVLFMLVAGGAAWRHLFAIGAAGAACAPLGWFVLGDYQRERILTFLDPSRDPLSSGWNALQSAIAVGSGGLYGKGFLNGTQNVLGFLPRTVSPSDFIFPVIAEETGFIGACLLLAAYVVLLACYLRAAAAARDPEGSLLATGIAGLLFCHAFVNIGMTVGLLPITGLPLPLVSSGGSFLLSTLAGFGLVQSVCVHRRTDKER
ncbi:MAG: rod shape-determining protein RodA [Kiritimatiellae bacterium]|nr:rod shape-determining protein RodA [Kiritimatiellia bacterium]